MRENHKMKLHLVVEQTSQAALKVHITKHTVNTDTEGLDQELQPCSHSIVLMYYYR